MRRASSGTPSSDAKTLFLSPVRYRRVRLRTGALAPFANIRAYRSIKGWSACETAIRNLSPVAHRSVKLTSGVPFTQPRPEDLLSFQRPGLKSRIVHLMAVVRSDRDVWRFLPCSEKSLLLVALAILHARKTNPLQRSRPTPVAALHSRESRAIALGTKFAKQSQSCPSRGVPERTHRPVFPDFCLPPSRKGSSITTPQPAAAVARIA
jgi:hypothetical protein